MNNQTHTPVADLPMAARRVEDVPGHWLLARLGKRVLRPGGRELTQAMLAATPLDGADVVELAPGMGWTARAILARRPRSYIGVDQSEQVSAIVNRVVEGVGHCATGEASATGLEDDSADVVIGEAMLTMQTDRGKSEIIAEAVRVLRPGGVYAIHELGLTPDDLDAETTTQIRQDLARVIKVNARPLTVSEWRAALESHGLEVLAVRTAPMALLDVRRNLADEGLVQVARIVGNVLRQPAARRRVLAMRGVFHRYRDRLNAVALVARVPLTTTTESATAEERS